MYYMTPPNIAMTMDSNTASMSFSQRSISSLGCNSSMSVINDASYSSIGYSLSNGSSSSFNSSGTSITTTSSGRPVRKSKKMLTPDYSNTIYNSVRDSVAKILEASTKFKLERLRIKGVVLVCGKDDETAAKEGNGLTIVPLMIPVGRPMVYVANPLIEALAKFASREETTPEKELPDVIVGLCCNNWGHYNSRNAFIEALLEIIGPRYAHKLSIHSAIYALDFNMNALEKILPSSSLSNVSHHDEERVTRYLHAEGFQATAAKYKIGFDQIERESHHCGLLSKKDFVEHLSNATIQAVEECLASNVRGRVLDLVVEILRQRQHIQENLNNKRFRRARSINGISVAAQKLQELLQEFLDEDELDRQLSQAIFPGWKDFAASSTAILRLFCHSVDVLAGCVARSGRIVRVTTNLAERLVWTILAKENRLLEYVFNQVYELMPSTCEDAPEKLYVYRNMEDLQMFSTMACGVAEMGGKL